MGLLVLGRESIRRFAEQTDWSGRCWVPLANYLACTLVRLTFALRYFTGCSQGCLYLYTELEISLFLLRRLLGVKTEDKKTTKVSKLAKNELLLINIGSTSTGGRVLSVKEDLAKIQLTSPACTEVGEKVALSRRIEKHWRLVGESLALFLFRFRVCV